MLPNWIPWRGFSSSYEKPVSLELQVMTTFFKISLRRTRFNQTPTKASMFNRKSAARLLHLSWEQVHLAALARLQDIAGYCRQLRTGGMSQHVRFLMIFQAACALVKDVNDLGMEMPSIEAHRRAFRPTHTWLSSYVFSFLGRETCLIQCQQWILLPNSLWKKGLHRSRVIQETLDSDSSKQSEDNSPWNWVILSL